MQAELEAVKSAAASREVELKFEIDRARQGRKELENRYAGLDPQKMAQEDHALAQANQVRTRGTRTPALKTRVDPLSWSL